MSQLAQYHTWEQLGYHNPTGQGFVANQRVYVANSPQNDWIRRETISFYDTTTGLYGISIDKALRQDFAGLRDRDARPVTTQGGNKIGIRILWPGYDIWTVHIGAVEGGVAAGHHITKARLAHEVAKKIRDFHRDMSTVRSTEENSSWWLNAIPLEQLVLLEIRNVSKGSWQPVIVWRV